MEIDEFDFHEEITIDQNALDQEWLQQPGLFLKWSAAEARARKECDEAKQEVDIIRASLDLDIRTNPEDYGITKITEAVLLTVIQKDKSYIEANGVLRKAKYHLDLISGAVRAMDHRRKALENLVVLQSQGYFSQPCAGKVGEKGREFIEKGERRAAHEIVRRRRRSSTGEKHDNTD